MNLPEAAEKDGFIADWGLDPGITPEEAASVINRFSAADGFQTSARSVRRLRESVHRTALVLGDFQVDLHDMDFINRVLVLAEDVQPDIIVHTGDETDATSVGRWVKGLPEEIEGNVQEQLDITKSILESFRRIPNVKEMGIVSSNHGLRFERSIVSRIPAFRHLRCLQYENLLELERLRIDYHMGLWEFLPGVFAAHGDQWALTSKQQYSKMQEVALKHGANFVVGHTHRPMLTTVSSYQRKLWVLNPGHCMDVSKADYLQVDRGGIPDWGQGVGIIHWDGLNTYPELVVNINGRMHWNGKTY